MLAMKWFPLLFAKTQKRNLHKNMNKYHDPGFVEQGE